MRSYSNPAARILRVKDPFGCLGNFSRHPVFFDGVEWHTSEHLFQALRFGQDDPIRGTIRGIKSAWDAKHFAIGEAQGSMVVVPRSSEDILNMLMVLKAKLDQHADVREVLLSTGTMPIVEDVTSRPAGVFWGAAWDGSLWRGHNVLGELWMGLRQRVDRP